MPVAKWSLAALLMSSVVSVPSFSATPDRIQSALNSGQTIALHGSVDRKAVPRYDVGPADPTLRFGSIMLLTTPTASQQAAMAQLTAEQQDPKSPKYHKWLTSEQWADQFGLSGNDIEKIKNWLSDQGFTNIQVAHARNWIVFSGTASQIQRAFGAEIHQYNVNGEMHVANATAPKIPAALAGVVTGIRGLDNFYLKPRVVRSVRPSYYDSSLGASFLAPGDIATIYDLNPLYNSSINGKGQKLVIVGQTDIYLSDINDFRSDFGVSSTPISCTTNSSGVITACNDPQLQYIMANGVEDPGVTMSNDLSEADLDLEWSGAVAPGAQLIYVNTPINTTSGTINGGGVWESWYYAVDQSPTLAPVISMSYGICEFGDTQISADETELKLANQKGITFVNSSGDSGAAECDPDPPLQASSADPYGASATGGYAVSYPASSPEVTAVGGTSISIPNLQSTTYWGQNNGSSGGSVNDPPGYIPEQAWNDEAEFVVFCQQSSEFCSQGGNPAISGWVAITDQQQAQQDLALAPYHNGISASGGGPSNCAVQNAGFTDCVSGFPQPTWQSQYVTISGQSGVRLTPDVSFLASPNFPGYIFCTEESELDDSGTGSACQNGIASALALKNPPIIGGTSVSTPIFAGIVTLLNQSLSQSGLGNVNPTLYKMAGTSAFHQVTSGTNTVYCTAGTPGSTESSINCPSTTPATIGFNASNDDAANGYNLVTGLGSVDANNLALAWAASLNGFGMTASAINPTSVTAGSSVTATITVAPSNGSNFNGTVSFSCANQTGITCTFSPTTVTNGSGTTTVTISVAVNVAGPITVTVNGTSGSLSASTSVGFAVTASSETFTLSSNIGSGTLSVKQGLTAQVNLTLSSNNGFVTTSGGNSQTVLPVSYTCSSSPTISLSNCTFSPTSPNQSTAVTVSITTTASTNALARPLDRGAGILYAALVPGLFGIVFIAGSRRSMRGIRMLGLVVVLGASTLWLGSCGGSNNSSTGSPGTPTGNYTVTINANTGGSGAISSSYQFTLTVTQ